MGTETVSHIHEDLEAALQLAITRNVEFKFHDKLTTREQQLIEIYWKCGYLQCIHDEATKFLARARNEEHQ